MLPEFMFPELMLPEFMPQDFLGILTPGPSNLAWLLSA
jgi:hypothetical protein